MTQEQKAKKYDEALEWMRKIYPTLTGVDKEDAEHYFPEVKESEDERIRKDILAFIRREGQHIDKYKWPKWIEWLEKQKDSVSKSFDDVWDEEDCEEIIAEGQKLTPRFKELLKEVCHAWYDRGVKLEKQKEQKPVEYLSKEKVYHIVSELTNLSLSGIIPIESEGYPKIVEIKSNVLKLLDYPIEEKQEQKPNSQAG